MNFLPPNGALHGSALDHLLRWNLDIVFWLFVAAQILIVLALILAPPRPQSAQPDGPPIRAASTLLAHVIPLLAITALYLWMLVTQPPPLGRQPRTRAPPPTAMKVEVTGVQFSGTSAIPAPTRLRRNSPHPRQRAHRQSPRPRPRRPARHRRHRLLDPHPPRRPPSRSPPARPGRHPRILHPRHAAQAERRSPASLCTFTSPRQHPATIHPLHPGLRTRPRTHAGQLRVVPQNQLAHRTRTKPQRRQSVADHERDSGARADRRHNGRNSSIAPSDDRSTRSLARATSRSRLQYSPRSSPSSPARCSRW